MSILIKAHHQMEEVGSSWTLKAKQLSQLLRGARSDEMLIVELLEQLNEFSYPLQGLAAQVHFNLKSASTKNSSQCLIITIKKSRFV